MLASRLTLPCLAALALAPALLGGCEPDRPLDHAESPDLTALPDLAIARDLAMPDMAEYRDLAVGNDLSQLPGYPAPHPPLAQVVSSGGPVMRAPELTAITFGNDPLQARIDAFTNVVASSRWWTAVASEYGVGPGHARPPVHLVEQLPRVLDDTEVAAWLADKIDGKAPGFGVPTPDSLFMIYYPARVSITEGGGMSCVSFGAYHNSATLADGSQVAYAVMPRCSALLDVTTSSAAHELVEAGTDPFPLVTPAYISVAMRDRGWAQVYHGGEVADMCQYEQTGYRTPEIGPQVVKSWSNAAARVDHQPCVPDDSDSFYFNSAPVLVDGNPIQLQVNVPRTIEVDLFSTGPTGAWDVDAMVPFGLESSYTFDIQPRSGRNGDKVMLTVTMTSLGRNTAHDGFIITSTLGKQVHYWPVGVRGKN